MRQATAADMSRCPQLPNPGREERFQKMTGKDAAVIDYLNQQPSVHQYLCQRSGAGGCERAGYESRASRTSWCRSAARAASTGSVFFAEQLAKHLRGNGGGRVVRHIEQEKREMEKMGR